MRKRLISKAFAVAMSGAMVFSASPVTANIFNVTSIVKAAEADQADEWTYCYVGLTWAEYWANEGVYNADNTSSSDVEDSHYEKDKGGYDAVTRATVNHGLHRGSFQGSAVIEAKSTDGSEATKEFSVSHWSSDGKKFYQSSADTTGISYSRGVITDTDGKEYKLTSYHVTGTKYVPVKVKTADLDALKANYAVVENGESLVGGYAENKLKSYSETANVTANTYGLKTATKQSDGSFSFSARSTDGTESGIKGQELKEATDITPNLRSGDSVGSYGETIRLDLNGDGYGDLGSNMQSVKWTFYGNDSTYTTPVKTYGTKFAADNWMHKSMGIQLGLTESNRFDLAGDQAVGYWKVTVTALGYKDYSYNFEVTSDNIAKQELASDAEVAALKAKIQEANSIVENKADYCADSFEAMQGELAEANEALDHTTLYAANINEALTHLSESIDSLKKHDYKDVVKEAASFDKDGSIEEICANCGDVKATKTIAKIASVTLSKTSYKENGKVQKPSVTVKDSKGSVIAASNYTVSYSNAKSTNPGTYNVTVTFKGNYTGNKTVSYKITAVAPAKTTVKLSSAKKTSLKATWKKVAKASSYEVQYATSKNFKGAKTVKVSSKTSSKVLTKLKKNKKYYVRVRAVRTVKVDNKNTTLRASWSSAKSLKTKKK